MKRIGCRSALPALFLAVSALLCCAAFAQQPTAEDALRLMPRQPDVNCDQPTAEEIADCTLTATTDSSGYVVRNGNGVTLRMFLDTDGDRSVDQWRYYAGGLEIYRDIDSNQNKTVDQFRWFHSAGTRWGVDQNEDGQIDVWQMMSAEEATAEVVEALKTRDVNRFLAVALSATDLQSLGLGTELTETISEVVEGQTAAFQQLAASQSIVSATTEWVQFSGNRPGLVPATESDARDVQYYANAVAFIQTGDQHEQVVIGNIVKVGVKWLVIGAPVLGEDEVKSDLFGPGGPVDPVGPDYTEIPQEIIDELDRILTALDQSPDTATKARLHSDRAAALAQIIALPKETEQRDAYIQNLIESLSAAIQMGEYPTGSTKLDQIAASLSSEPALASYAKYRSLRAVYGLRLIGRVPEYVDENGQPDYEKILTAWLASLQQFIEENPTAIESAEAMLELGNNNEFSAQITEAIRWYEQIISTFPESLEAQKATGAITRLQSEGQVFAFSGQTADGQTIDLADHRGKVVLIQYWASWCDPCKTDILILKELFSRYGQSRFVVIGVNVDLKQSDMDAFLVTNHLPWTLIHEEGGLDSPPALALGVLNVPTMLLVDQQGRLVNRSIQTMDLEREISGLLTP
jgi:thiol-disulfide isomerase/thioredoxin